MMGNDIVKITKTGETLAKSHFWIICPKKVYNFPDLVCLRLLIVWYQRLSCIQVLNCQNCNQCLKCHKSPGLSFQNCQKLSQFGGSQAKMRWSDVMGSGEVLNSTKKSIENPRITQ